jgi:ribose/xylose/arabinose/galactoside ABC-type transport system permease subunit
MNNMQQMPSDSSKMQEKRMSNPQLVKLIEWFKTKSRRQITDYGFTVGFILLTVIAATTTDVFFSQQNISNLFRQIVTNGLLSLGMLIVILTGGIDLSVGSVVALSGIMAAGLQAYIPFPLAILVALGVGMLAGSANGWLIARFKVQPFIVTLATMGAIRGVVYVYSETPQVPADPAFRYLLGGGFIGAVPVAALIMLAFYPLMWIFLNRSTYGRAVVAIGGNEEAVRLAGINVKSHIMLAYILSGLFSAIAGVLLASRLGIAQPSVGAAYELDAIAAVVIGGGILGGGGGGAIGTFGGVLALGLIDNLLNLFNVQSYYQQIFKGIIILLAVLVRRKE